MRQFKIERRDRRIDISLKVRLTGADINDKPLDQEVVTVNVSRKGSLLTGIRGEIRLGSHVSLARLGKVEQFLVAWVGEEKTPKAGQIGVSALDPATSFWNDVIETQSQTDGDGDEGDDSQEIGKKPKARAQGA